MSDLDLTAATQAAQDAIVHRRHAVPEHRDCGTFCAYWFDADVAVRAAVPLIAAHIREQIAQEIRRNANDLVPVDDFWRGHIEGMSHVATMLERGYW